MGFDWVLSFEPIGSRRVSERVTPESRVTKPGGKCNAAAVRLLFIAPTVCH
jgi:hypothetical protein